MRDDNTMIPERDLLVIVQPLLDALERQTAILDANCTVIAVNSRWTEESTDCPRFDSRATVGTDYLKLCGVVGNRFGEVAKAVGTAVLEIQEGDRNSYSLLYPCTDGEGRKRFFEGAFHRFYWGDKVYVLISHLEVSDLLNADTDLAQSRELLTGVFNSTLHGIVALSSVRDLSGSIVDFEFVMINPSAERFIGIKADQATDRRLLELFPELKDNGLFGKAVEVAETGNAFRTEQYIESRHIQGWFNISVARFGDGIVISFLDISELKRSEQARRESEERLRAILDNTEEILYTLDAEGRYSYVSPAITRNLGYQPADLQGKSVAEFTHSDDVTKRLDSIKEVFASGKPVRGIQYRLRHSDGSWRWYAATGSIARYVAGGSPAFVGVSYDITEKKKVEHELEHYRHLLEQIAQQRKREFDAVSKKLHREVDERINLIEKERADIAREVHDELGQFLTALKYDLSWLRQRNSDADSEARARLESALSSIEESIKSVRRISTRLRPAVLSDLGLAAAMEWFASDFQQRTGIKVQIDLPEEEIEIGFERATALFRVFQEALTNVARHAGASGVRVTLSSDKGLVSLCISDDGVGFAPESLADTKSFGITGMRERIGFLGGQFKIQGRPGQGTKVWVSVPRPERVEPR